MKNEKSRRILYIEDHEDTRELVTLLLSQKSYEVITGTTLESGVALAGAGDFDLYLLDSWLPDGSGLDLCKRIRQFDKTTPILFYSAAAYAADSDLALKSGAQAYLVKPSPPSALCDLVTELIERSGQTRSSARACSCGPERSP
jgi:DNA-binding response OmpR family regulator